MHLEVLAADEDGDPEDLGTSEGLLGGSALLCRTKLSG